MRFTEAVEVLRWRASMAFVQHERGGNFRIGVIFCYLCHRT